MKPVPVFDEGIFDLLRRDRLDALAEPDLSELLEDSGRRFSEEFVKSSDFESIANELVQGLARAGHDLRLFDAGFDVDVDSEMSYLWCGDWEANNPTRLIVTVHSVHGVKLEWSEHESKTGGI